MGFIVYVAICGAASAAAMAIFLKSIAVAGIVRRNIIALVAARFSTNPGSSFLKGLIIHLAAGAFFAFGYVRVWQIVGLHSPFQLGLAGAAAGLGHGLVVSLLAINFLTERPDKIDPGPAYGFAVALAYVVGHIIYGITLGLLVSIYPFFE
jgi:hypothetical protein